MAPPLKRCSYVSDSESSSSEDNLEVRYKYGKQDRLTSNENIGYNRRRSKCSTKNAIMARENRIKKKLYMQQLEHEVKILRKDNSKLSRVIQDQSTQINKLQKHMGYMKSVLANSADLRLLMNNIQRNTGMSVTTSLDKSLTFYNDCVCKPELRKADVFWNNDTKLESNLCFDALTDMDSFAENIFPDLFNFESESVSQNNNSNEHNYTLTSTYKEEPVVDDVGVCLHVSKHRVSLEFCSSCSENANESWKESGASTLV